MFAEVIYMVACACCEEEEGEAAVEDEESEEVEGWRAEDEAEEEEVAVAADDEVSTMLLWVMKRRRSFMAGRRVMMIFSTWREATREKAEINEAKSGSKSEGSALDRNITKVTWGLGLHYGDTEDQTGPPSLVYSEVVQTARSIKLK